jgi:hypothetical protein
MFIRFPGFKPAVVFSVLVVASALCLAGNPAIAASIFVSMEHPVVSSWPADANGDVAPSTTVTGASTNLSTPYSIDVYGGLIYVGDESSSRGINIFPVEANGDVSPARNISGNNTGLGNIDGIAVDSTGIYVSNGSKISVFAPDADGNAVPLRVISGSATLLTSTGKISLDDSFIYVSNPQGHPGNPSFLGKILVFPKGAQGDTAPLRVISGNNTGLNLNYGLEVDGSWIYALNYGAPYSVRVFPINGAGDITPTRIIEGNNTTLDNPFGLTVDSEWIYVANYDHQSVDVFAIGDDGNIAPTRTISGSNTPLDGWPSGIAVTGSDTGAAAATPVPATGRTAITLLIGALGLLALLAIAGRRESPR